MFCNDCPVTFVVFLYFNVRVNFRKLTMNERTPHTMGYAGIENGLEFENVLASSWVFFDFLNFSRSILRGI
jgi:hypothetical protein